MSEERNGSRFIEHIKAGARRDLLARAEQLGLLPAELLEFQKIYYLCDAGSYTTTANGGVPQLPAFGRSAFDDLFVFEEKPVPAIRFAEPYATRMTDLEAAVRASPNPVIRLEARSGERAAGGDGGAFVSAGNLAVKHEPIPDTDSGGEAARTGDDPDKTPTALLRMRLTAMASEQGHTLVARSLARMTDQTLESIVRGGRDMAGKLLVKRGQEEMAPLVGSLRMTDTVFLSVALLARADAEASRIVGRGRSESSESISSPSLLPIPAGGVPSPSVLQVLR